MNREIRSEYQAQLRSYEWREFSFKTIKAHPRCDVCGETDKLEVHHTVYHPGRKPWEYCDFEVRVLCRYCHESIHKVADLVWVELLRFDAHEIEILLKRIRESKEVRQRFENDGSEGIQSIGRAIVDLSRLALPVKEPAQ